MPSALFLASIPKPCAIFIDEGMRLAEKTRPYLTKSGALNIRLVFRSRENDISHVASFTLAGPVNDALADALLDALPRGFRITPSRTPAPPAAA
jgi:hypothetical protein